MLRTQAGIHSVKVALLAERGVVEYDPNVWDPDKIINVSGLLCSYPSAMSASEWQPASRRISLACIGRCVNARHRCFPGESERPGVLPRRFTGRADICCGNFVPPHLRHFLLESVLESIRNECSPSCERLMPIMTADSLHECVTRDAGKQKRS